MEGGRGKELGQQCLANERESNHPHRIILPTLPPSDSSLPLSLNKGSLGQVRRIRAPLRERKGSTGKGETATGKGVKTYKDVVMVMVKVMVVVSGVVLHGVLRGVVCGVCCRVLRCGVWCCGDGFGVMRCVAERFSVVCIVVRSLVWCVLWREAWCVVMWSGVS